jgi:hypothetical protein
MRYFTLLSILLFFKPSFSQTGSHTVQSSCTAHDTIKQKYFTDAERLALRRVFYINSTYKDSIDVDTTVRNRYLDALLAVYNATAIPQRDTVVKTYKVHTDLNPELRMVSFKAPGTYAWMDSLNNNASITNNPPLDNLITQYSLTLWGYYVSSTYDQVLFMAANNLNTQALANKFLTINGVIGANPEPGFNDEKNIKDSTNTGFLILTYSIGWGTCFNGCDFRRYWEFKVDTNCVVEFLKTYGDPIALGLSAMDLVENNVKAYPNPFSEKITLENSGNTPIRIEIQNILGESLYNFNLESKLVLNTPELAPGIYFINIQGNDQRKTIKIIKDH